MESWKEREKHFNNLSSSCDSLRSAMCDIFQNEVPIDNSMIDEYQKNIQLKLDEIREYYAKAQIYLHSIKTTRSLCTCNHCGQRIEFDERYISIDKSDFAYEVFTCPICKAIELWDNMD